MTQEGGVGGALNEGVGGCIRDRRMERLPSAPLHWLLSGGWREVGECEAVAWLQ